MSRPCPSLQYVPVRGYWVPAHCRALPRRHFVPKSVEIAQSWKDPVREITPQFLDQLANDLDIFT